MTDAIVRVVNPDPPVRSQMVEAVEVVREPPAAPSDPGRFDLTPGIVAPLAREVLLCALCLAGVAQSGRAADL